jgi:hypothetical protein
VVAESSEFDNDRWAVGLTSPTCATQPRYQVKAVSWAADDLIGSLTYTYRPEYLAQRLPAIGRSFADTRTYGGGGGTYTMTTMVSRVG